VRRPIMDAQHQPGTAEGHVDSGANNRIFETSTKRNPTYLGNANFNSSPSSASAHIKQREARGSGFESVSLESPLFALHHWLREMGREVLIGLIGVTGSGKTTFASIASGQTDLEIGYTLKSCGTIQPPRLRRRCRRSSMNRLTSI
jgi:hypothetical protein